MLRVSLAILPVIVSRLVSVSSAMYWYSCSVSAAMPVLVESVRMLSAYSALSFTVSARACPISRIPEATALMPVLMASLRRSAFRTSEKTDVLFAASSVSSLSPCMAFSFSASLTFALFSSAVVRLTFCCHACVFSLASP